MKTTVIGGGSTYTPELVGGFLALAGVLPLEELCLMDIDRQRLDVGGGFARRTVRAKGGPFNADKGMGLWDSLVLPPPHLRSALNR